MKTFIPCIVCGRKADWFYMPGSESYCDNHVPRGCSCNAELKEGIDIDSEEATNHANYYEPVDDQGRKYPCCEYSKIDPSFHDNKEFVEHVWENYYKNHPYEKLQSEAEFWEHKLER